MTAAVIVLAAGRGTRIGMPKALLSIGGEAFVARVVRTASATGVERIVVVVGARGDEVRALVPADPGRVDVVTNTVLESDTLTSLRAGLARLDDLATEPSVDTVLVWPVDHPCVRIETVRAVLAEGTRSAGCAVVPVWSGRGGHPTLFPRAMFARLRAGVTTGGARAVLREFANRVVRLDVGDPAVVRDIDTPEDYAALRRSGR